jgi:hypothetical protein
VEGTNKAHENGEAIGFVGVRLTAQLGQTPFVERLNMNAPVGFKCPKRSENCTYAFLALRFSLSWRMDSEALGFIAQF